MRVLITGSRDYRDRAQLEDALEAVLGAARSAPGAAEPLIVVHGAARGADTLASHWCRRRAKLGVTEEAHPADWDRLGKAAGVIRNAEMVAAGADLVLAFYRAGAANRGTAHCALLARRAGIKVLRYEQET